MAGERPLRTIAECASSEPYSTQIGPFGKALMADEYAESGVPVLRGINVNRGRFHDNDFVFITDETADRLSKFESYPGDVLLVHKGTLGQIGLMPSERKYRRYIMGNSMMRVRCDPAKLLPAYLYYWLSSAAGQHYLFSRVSQVGVPQIQTPLTTLRQAALPVPPIPEQRAIAHILGTLDDKIELNRRMNETLEAMARALFKSWFVDFDAVRAKVEGRDPGLAKPIADLFPDSFEDSELGEIPARWRAGRLDELLAQLVSGARPKGGAVEEGVPSIGAENVIGLGRYDFSKEKFVPREFFEQLKLKGAAARPGDVLLYKDGAQIGRKTYFDCDFPHSECAINEHVFILRANRPEEQRFLFFWLDQAWMTHEIISLNSNSAQPGINQPGVRGLPALIPRDQVIDAFDQLTVRLTRRLFASCKESRTLAALRDALLPKLISGKLG